MRRLKPGNLSINSASKVSTAKSGIKPTIERTLSGKALAVGQDQDVVDKTIFAVPKLDALAADIVHGSANIDKVLEELARDIFVGGIFLGQLQGNG